MSTINIIQADYNNPEHAAAIVALLDAYASDPMGGGTGLSQYSQDNVVEGLKTFPTSITLLAQVDDNFVGILNAFTGFSTFQCKPLFNIHDIAVLKRYRGQSIATQLLTHLESLGRQRDYCKLTLEVLEGNSAAKKTYQKFGFGSYELDPEAGHALFWEKVL